MYYIKEENGIITRYAEKEDVDSGKIRIDWTSLIDYEPPQWNGFIYTKEKFSEIQKTAEYIAEQLAGKKFSFDFESKQMEVDASYIEYQGKKLSLQEILFKSLVYTSVTDLEVYLKSEDGDLVKMSRTKFLLIAAKAKSNLKDTEEALYNAVNNYDPTKSLEESLAALKSVLDSINKIFNS